jgi:hypothetical protein
MAVLLVAAGPTDVAQSENCSGYGRRIGQRPGLTAVFGSGGAGVVEIVGIEIAAANDAVPGSRKATVKPPALGELRSGVSYAFQVLPASRVARILAVAAPPVVIQAFLAPWVATHVPLEANENSPGNAGGILLLMSCQVLPFVVRRSGKIPFTESLCERPRLGVQKAKQS